MGGRGLERNSSLMADKSGETNTRSIVSFEGIQQQQKFLKYQVKALVNHDKINIELVGWFCNNFKGGFENKDVWCVTKSYF